MTAWALAAGWLAGEVPDGIAVVGGSREVHIAIDGDPAARAAVVAALARGCTAAELAAAADSDPGEARELLARLSEQGAVAPGGPPAATVPDALATAIRAVAAGIAVTRAWTADELLVLPAGASPDLARRAVRAFAGGLEPDLRLAAYAHLAATRGTSALAGDTPDPAAVRRAAAVAAELDPAGVHVVPLDGGAVSSVAADDLGALGFGAPHRLGPLQALTDTAPTAGGRCTAAARHAPPTLRGPRPAADRRAHGTGADPEAAQLLARAEAAERFALGDPAAVELVRARPGELGDHVAPGALQRWSARQLADHPDRPRDADAAERLWVHASAPGGEPRWVPAEAVIMPFEDPVAGRTLELTSSGAAAHATAAAAAERAVLELIERDAFLWTWVQRVSRERIAAASLPAAARAIRDALAAGGRAVDLVNLTIETCPVVLVVVHDDASLQATCAAAPTAAAAAERALSEAAMLLASLRDAALPDVRSPREVRTPEDHLALHRGAAARAAAAFLTAAPDGIELGDVRAAAGTPLEAVRAAGEPLLVDLTTPATAPFHVVRALVPGLVPLSFGWDREPLGMARLGSPLRTADGRVLGRALDLPRLAPVAPHPFT